MPLTVYYVPWDTSKNLLQEAERLYDEAGTFDCIEKDDKPTCSKFTCKFEIQIENDKLFKVAQKIIGTKGVNMKRILDACSKNNEELSVKLRLRGKGSGFKEGANRQGKHITRVK